MAIFEWTFADDTYTFRREHAINIITPCKKVTADVWEWMRGGGGGGYVHAANIEEAERILNLYREGVV